MKEISVMLVIALIISLLLLAPMLFLWSLNSLAEAGGLTFYIEHTVWNYVYAFVFIAVVRGTTYSSKD